MSLIAVRGARGKTIAAERGRSKFQHTKEGPLGVRWMKTDAIASRIVVVSLAAEWVDSAEPLMVLTLDIWWARWAGTPRIASLH